ncbi:ABC transporter permease [Algoriphagus sp.]|uniref:ABC transporter permease n=1 Tax=Algoriphagus sp. TaxID=1872435 RepID=UPI002633B20E|nr:ABC transporter permease [Algoriphagus sp.]
MVYHYLKIAYRHLSRNSFFSFITILGLAVGMGVCLLIYQYVDFETSFDRFHSKSQNTYRLTQSITRNGENQGEGVFTTFGLGPRGKETIPEIKDFVRVHDLEIDLVVSNPSKNEPHLEDKLWFVDSTFLNLFDFSLKYGDKHSVFREKNSAVITEEMAIKYFGDPNPIGQFIQLSGGVLSGSFKVTGVLNSLPANSHLQFDFLFPLPHILDNYGQYKSDQGWDWDNFVTYVNLNESANLPEVSKKLDELVAANRKESLDESRVEWHIGFQSLEDIHLTSTYSRELARNNGDIQNVYFFSIIAIFILLMAWTNSINLFTAQSLTRTKELGVRKSIGAVKSQLIFQFMMESLLINFLAGILSLVLAHLLLPVLNQIMGQELEFTLAKDSIFWISFIGMILLGSFLSASYPAIILSSFKPTGIFKNAKFSPRGSLTLKKYLIVFQFIISLLLISGTFLVYRQINFLKEKDLGINLKEILVVSGPRVILESLREKGETLGPSYAALKNLLTSHSTISFVTATSTVPSKGYEFRADAHRSDRTEDATVATNLVLADSYFTQTFGFDFLAKSDIPENYESWTYTFINESALKAFNFNSPQEALGAELEFLSYQVKILGVVKDVHWSSLKEANTPTFFVLEEEYGAYFSILIQLDNLPSTLAHIEDSYNTVFPDDPFEYFFLDDSFNRQYLSDLQFQNLFFAFSLLAISIASLGLFALVSYSVNLKVKELGVRKVLGASRGNLMLLLSREYLVLLGMAIALAIPLVLIGANSWLENYAYRIEIGPEIILIPALILFSIAVITLSFKTVKASKANPADSLRSE